MDNRKTQELIDDYILNKLAENERVSFEKQMDENPELKQEVELTRHISFAIQKQGEERIFNTLKSMSEDEFRQSIGPEKSNDAKIKKLVYIGLSTAAAILILVFIGTRPLYSPVSLYNQYYGAQIYESYFTREGSILTNDEKLLVRQAKEFYQQKDYKNALIIYNRLFEQKIDWKNDIPDEVIFYSAICQLETNDLFSAIERFEYLATNNESDFQKDGQWNLAFAYLKSKQREKAKECFQVIMNDDNEHSKNAEEIYNKLNKKRLF